MKTAVIVQARMGSDRLPGKSMMEIEGKPLLWHVLSRVQKIRHKDVVVLATPDTPENDCLDRVAWDTGCEIYRGGEHDVLARYYHAAKSVDAGIVVRVTGDCPLIDPKRCDRVINAYLNSCSDYVSNIYPVRSVPSGYDCEAFSFELLELAFHNATSKYDREHVTPWIKEESQSRNRILSDKLSVDTQEDLDRVRAVFKSYHSN